MEDDSQELVAMASVPSYASDIYVNCVLTEVPETSTDMGLQLSKDEDKESIVSEDHDHDEAAAHQDGSHHDDFHHHDLHHDDLHHDDLHHEDQSKGPQTCRGKLREFLHTQKFQIIIIVLVVLDCGFVIGELVLDYEALANAKCPAEVPPTNESGARHRRTAEEHDLSPTEKAAEALHYLSLIILSVFMVELMLKLFALGTKFFHSKLEVFDAIIIIVSFVLDIITLVFPENFAIVDLIVVLRLWRILRIVNGVILSVEQRAEKRVDHHKRVKERAVHAAMEFERYSAALEEETQKLRELLEANGVKIDETQFKDRPEKPHYDRKYHLDDGHHHHHLHLHLPFHLHKKHAQPESDDAAGASAAAFDAGHPDDGEPPDYDALHHGNHEESC